MKKFIGKLRQSQALILDTETTGLNHSAEILQIGIVNLDGEELLDTLVRPIHARRWPDAQRVHGLSWADVKDAPTIADLAPDLRRIMEGKMIAVYNAQFDSKMLRQSIIAAQAQEQYRWLDTYNWPCVMKSYASYYGEPNRRYGGYRWQRLDKACRQQGIRVSNAHNALADARMTAALIRAIEQRLE